MELPSLFLRLRDSRRVSLAVFGITLVALIATAALFIAARSSLAQAYARLGERNQALVDAQTREQEARLKVDYARSSQALVEAANVSGLEPEVWGERLINLRQSQMSREETSTLLAAVRRDRDRMFGADAFELSVTHPDEGLFDAPAIRDRAPAPLSLTLRGAILFRTDVSGAAPMLSGGAQ